MNTARDRGAAPGRAGFVVFLSALVFGPLAFGCVEPWSVSILEVLVFCGLLICSVEGLRLAPSAVHRAVLPAVAALALLGAVQVAQSRSPQFPAGLAPFTGSLHETSNAVRLWLCYAALLLCVPGTLGSPARVRFFAWTIFLLGFVVAMVGLIQQNQGRGPAMIYGMRPVLNGAATFGPYYNPNHAASLMGMSLFAGFGIFFGRLSRWPARERVGILADLIAFEAAVALMLGIIVAGIFASGSRGALGALAVALAGACVLYAWRFQGRRRWTILGALALALAGLGARVYVNRYNNRFYLQALRDGAADRESLYRSGAEIAADFPIFGAGLSALPQAFPPYQSAGVQGRVEHAHSDWLQILIETGWIGFAVLAGGLSFFFLRAIRGLASCREEELRMVAGGILAGAASFAVHALIESSFQIPANAAIFFSLIACLGSAAIGGGRGAPARMPRWSAAVLGVLAAGGMLTAIPPLAGAWYAYRADGDASVRARFLRGAIRWDREPDYLYRLGSAYENLAESAAAGNEKYLRQALDYSSQALGEDASNRRYRRLQGAILWRLGRSSDAAEMLK